MGHVGRDRTLSLIQSRFYWPGLTSDVEKWLTNCIRCQCRKAPVQQAPLVPMTSSQPMELCCMDFLTVEPSQGYENILVITDHFSKFAQAFATKNQTAKTTAKVLFNNFIVHYGVPGKILTDQGRNFESQIIRELCMLLGTRKVRTTSYHPMGNGHCERMNRTLLGMLGTLEAEKKTRWKDHLSTITHAYNCTKHASTGFSPYMLMFGREPQLPIDRQFGLDKTADQTSSASYSDYVEQLKERLQYAWKLAGSNQEVASSKQKTHYDRRQRGSVLEPGDVVLIRKLGVQGRHKLQDFWEEEPWIVKCCPNEGIPVYHLYPKSGRKSLKVLHRNHMLPTGDKVSVPTTNDAKKSKPKPSVKSAVTEALSSDSDEDFVVDITSVGHRDISNGREMPEEDLVLQLDLSDSPDNEDMSETEIDREPEPVHQADMVDQPENITVAEADTSLHSENASPIPSPTAISRPSRNVRPPKRYANDNWQMSQVTNKPVWAQRASFLLEMADQHSSLETQPSLLQAVVELMKTDS